MGPDVADAKPETARADTRVTQAAADASASDSKQSATTASQEDDKKPLDDKKVVDDAFPAPDEVTTGLFDNGALPALEDGKPEPGLDFSDQTLDALPVSGGASAGKRESAIMRINNRLKALELNMSLSSR